MCAGAVLLHNLGRVVFGALDPAGGVSSCLEALPPYFKREFGRIQWLGPAFTSECDPLYTRIVELERRRADTLGHDDPA
jgi:tRNA(Arg) A34 adenosine deaminase TadA